MTCIYCKSETAPAARVAHIAPQALMPSDVTLPLGAECDGCNEYAGQLELALIHHNRIWPILMLAGIRGKKGRPRKRLGRFTRTQDGLSVESRDIARITFTKDAVDVQVSDPPEYDDLRFRRGLHHMAFNYLAWKKGLDYVLDSKFDPVRQYVRQAQPGQAWTYAQVMYPDDRPNKTLRLTLLDNAPGCVVRFISFLDEFYVDLLNTGHLHAWARTNLPEGVGVL